MLPTSAVIYPMPTHQIIHTKVGAKLSMGSLTPNNPATTTSEKTATDRIPIAALSAELDNTGPTTLTLSRLSLGYLNSTPLRPTNSPMTKNDNATVATAPMRNIFNGTGRS